MHWKIAYKENIKIILTVSIFSIFLLYLSSKFFPTKVLQVTSLVLLLNILTLAGIPFIYKYKLSYELQKDFPFFLVLLYSIADVTKSRKRFFEIVGESEEYKYPAGVMKKIAKLAINLRMGFAEAMREVSKAVPKGIFKDFLDRFSSALETGEDLSEYLEKEIEASLDSYEVAYKKSLENIKILQEMLVAFMSSLGFGIVLVLIIPFLTGIDIMYILSHFILIFAVVNILVLLLSKYLIIDDNLLHNLPDVPEEYKKIQILFILTLCISVVMFSIVNRVFPDIPILLKLTISLTPLTYVSWRVILFEREVRKKEDIFPTFLSTLSGILETKAGNQIKAMDSIRIHDFKSLNKHIHNLYKRMLLTLDYIKSWYYFAAEIGSNLISKSVLIFSRAVSEGGSPEKVSKKIVDIVFRILDLRKMKEQFLSSTRGMLVGGYIAFVAIMYVSIQIIKLLQNLFTGISELLSSEIMQSIGIFFSVPINVDFIRVIIDTLAFIQAFVVAVVIRNIHGGSRYRIFLEAIVLLWIACFISIGVSYFFQKFFTSPISLPTPQLPKP